MSDDSETVEDTKKGSQAEVTDDSCILEFIEIVPLDRPSDDYLKPEFIDPVVEVKPEDLQEVKQEPADVYGTVGSCFAIQVSSLIYIYIYILIYQLLLHDIIKTSSTISVSETNRPFIKFMYKI